MNVDVAIIGGGIAGMSAAAYVAEHLDVVVVEAEAALGYHATGRSAAIYTECYGPGPVPTLARLSKEFFVDGDEPLGSPRGVMFASRAEQQSTVESLFDRFRPTVANLRRLTTAEMLETCPSLRTANAAAGILEPDAMDLDVHGVLSRYQEMARARGAVVRLDQRVHTIGKSHKWRLSTDNLDIHARVIVNAAGAWGDTVAGTAGIPLLGLTPLRRSAFIASPGVDARRWPMVVDVDENWYLKPEGPNILGSAASEIPAEPADARPGEIDVARGIDRINNATTLDIRSIKSSWAGLRTFTPDREPAVGFDSHTEGFFWLVGQGGYGIKTSPAMGQLTASLIRDAPLMEQFVTAGITPETLSPDRFDRVRLE